MCNLKFYYIGEEEKIECTAEHGQPKGEFIWKIGEDKNDEHSIIWNVKDEEEVEEHDDGYFTVTQVKQLFSIMHV